MQKHTGRTGLQPGAKSGRGRSGDSHAEECGGKKGDERLAGSQTRVPELATASAAIQVLRIRNHHRWPRSVPDTPGAIFKVVAMPDDFRLRAQHR